MYRVSTIIFASIASWASVAHAFEDVNHDFPVPEVSALRFLGEAVINTGTSFEGTEIGGMSGIDFDPYSNQYYVISDDRSSSSPARFYTAKINLEDGRLDNGDISFTSVVTILDKNNEPFTLNTVDPEAIRFDPFRGTLFWTSEGDANDLQNPFVREMDTQGKFIRELFVPSTYFPTEDQTSGIRNNLAFENLTFSFGRSRLVTATENALIQDGDAASLDYGSRVRFLELHARTGKTLREFFYVTEPIAQPTIPPGEFSTNGLVEILSTGYNQYIAIERSFSVGVGNSIKIFNVDARYATNLKYIRNPNYWWVQPAQKELLLDLNELNITLDNIEGITFGPRLPTGELTLILVSDNNFNETQFTQFLAFAVEATH